MNQQYSQEYIQSQRLARRAIAHLRNVQVENIRADGDDYVRLLATMKAKLAGRSDQEAEDAGVVAALELEFGTPAPKSASDFGTKISEIDEAQMQHQLSNQFPTPSHPQKNSHIPQVLSDADERLMRDAIAQSGFELGIGRRSYR